LTTVEAYLRVLAVNQGFRWARLALLGAVVLVLAGCSGGQPAPAAPPAADAATTRSVTHALGVTEIPPDPQRVVSASLTMAGPLLGLGVPLVGTATTRPGGVADPNGFFLGWADVAVERGVQPLGGPVVPVEAVAAQQPDLIVGSAVGADAVTPELYAQLSAVAPTVVFDHSALSWQELEATLAAALGREDAARAGAAEFERAAAALPAGFDRSRPAAVLTVTPEGYNVFTAESAQGKFMASLGVSLADLGDAAQGAGASGGNRRDVVRVAPENAGAFAGASLYFVNAEDADVAGYARQPVLGALPAFAEGRAFALGPESFRLDRFSARRVLDRIGAAAG
jgi:ABC-type Fe2+-enterobactin transport system substrate-binding protein